jgi:hypothetical protein
MPLRATLPRHTGPPLYPETLLIPLHQSGFNSADVMHPTSDNFPEIARIEADEYWSIATV